MSRLFIHPQNRLSIDHSDPDAQLREGLEGLRDDPDALIEIILRQAGQIRELTNRVEELEQKVKELTEGTDRLREEREEARREGKRQAAPFRTEEKERSGDPDPLGRREGHKEGNLGFLLPGRAGPDRPAR